MPWFEFLSMPSMPRLAFVALTAAAQVGLPGLASAQPAPAPSYALDVIPRVAGPCPKVPVVVYRGEVLDYAAPIWIHPDFQPKLLQLETIAREVATEVYGRAPTRIVHLGGYACRAMRSYSGWLSEHALGNAIDVEGFDFPALAKGSTLPPGVDRSLKNGFEVRVLRHWGKTQGVSALHARFLRTLALRLIARRDGFRVLLGPGYPGHQNHFHFDMAPYRRIEISENGVPLA
jgi:hypothetical protein